MAGVLRVVPGPPSELDLESAYPAPARRPDGRPWVTLSMVTSLDGSVEFEIPQAMDFLLLRYSAAP